MSYRRYLWKIENISDPRQSALGPRLPLAVFQSGVNVLREEILQEVYTPAHPSQTDQIKQNIINSKKTALLLLNPKNLNHPERLYLYESYFAYVKRVRRFLYFEAFMRDPLSLEERVICQLLQKYKVKVDENGDIILGELGNYLDSYMIPQLIKNNITTFCEFLLKRYPISSYCWFCGRINPFSRLPETVGLLPSQYKRLYDDNRRLRCIYLHRLNWIIKFGRRGIMMPFHTLPDSQCEDIGNCESCENETRCPIEADFELAYQTVTENYVELDMLAMSS